MTAPLLEVRDLRVEFPTRRGTLVALDGLSFDIAPGEMLGVVGESGAGKSLTGAAIIGLLEPPSRVAGGRIVFDGQRIDDLPAPRLRELRGRQIGAIFQDPLTSLNPLYTVGRQLTQTLELRRGMDSRAARERAIELLRETGIPAPELRLDRYPHQFSGGMRQRVVIALALAAEPRLVIADEPTTALDVVVQAQVMALLRRITESRGAAVMLITHDMGVIAQTCDRVAVMYAGRLVEIGPVDEVLRRPAHPYSAGLMAAVPRLEDELSGAPSSLATTVDPTPGEATPGAAPAPRRTRLAQIEGSLPRLEAIPPGCAFHPRCPRALPRCVVERPELESVRGTRAACWSPMPRAGGHAVRTPIGRTGSDAGDGTARLSRSPGR